MGKRVLFVVVAYDNSKMKENTKNSIQENLGKEDAYVFVKSEDRESEMYCELKDQVNKVVNDVNNFDYVCLVNNGSILSSSAKEIFEDYQVDRDDNIIESYLPLVLSSVDNMAITLNKHIWNSMIASEAGVLDIDLAVKQVDSTIFGAFIPVSLFFNSAMYNKEVKFYQQYHLLNNLADGDNLVLGIPKITLTVNDWDFKLDGLDKEEKIKYFNLARDKWTRKKKVEQTDSVSA